MFDIDRSNKTPLYMQVRDQIILMIKDGELRAGDKMPTERELSKKLRTSRNTISTAYNLLELSGLLVSYQGKGTFVVERPQPDIQHDKQIKLIKLIDISIDEAFEMGINSKEFLAIATERIKVRGKSGREF